MTSITKIHNSISILFVRDTNNSKKDDSIVIKPTDTDNFFQVTYKDLINKSKHEIHMTGESLRSYILSLFHIVGYDSVPFDSVQISFPMFPCIMIDMKDVKDENLRFRLQAMIDFTLKTSFANSDEDDMPPLESIPPLPSSDCDDCECDCS
jgi:hypothetical protein